MSQGASKYVPNAAWDALLLEGHLRFIRNSNLTGSLIFYLADVRRTLMIGEKLTFAALSGHQPRKSKAALSRSRGRGEGGDMEGEEGPALR